MKPQHIGVILLLVGGLLGAPVLTHAEEEGSSSGQSMHEHQSHHAKDGKVKPTGTAPSTPEGSGTTVEANTVQQDGRGKPAAAQEPTNEGSH
jgi:hypothetical protein